MQGYDCIYNMLGSSIQLNANSVSRFAPSPTGGLHLGHAYSAVRAHDLARAAGGQFLLRMEDIDQQRCRADHSATIIEDLRWLGLGWDGPILIQSRRTEAYSDALGQLQSLGLVYRCWCTRAEIAAAAGAPHGPQAIYPGTCRGRSPPLDGRAFCWRLDSVAAARLAGPLVWHDAQAGCVTADPARLGDVVLARKDAGTSYHIAVVVDDAWQGVTDVVRGEDLFDSTHVHRLLQALLRLPVPLYHHHRLILDSSGERLAKRRSSPTLTAMRADGINPQSLVDALRQDVLPNGYAFST